MHSLIFKIFHNLANAQRNYNLNIFVFLFFLFLSQLEMLHMFQRVESINEMQGGFSLEY